MKQLAWFRGIGLCVAIILAVDAGAGLVQQFTRPTLRAWDFFATGARTPTGDDRFGWAAWMTLNGDILADQAAAQSQQALDGTLFDPSDRAALNAAAQAAMTSALRASPINSSAWLILGLLKAQMNEVPTGPVKTSYFTGPIAPDGLAPRIRVIATTAAVMDDDIRLLAQSDVRTVLTRYGRLEPALAASYRQATADGKKFLLDATQGVDPKFSSLLRQYQ